MRFLIASKYLNFLWCMFIKCVCMSCVCKRVVKTTPMLIFYWGISTNLRGSYFCANRQKVLPKKNSFVRKNVMIWQKCRAIKNVRHSRKRGREVDKKSNKKWRRGRGRSQKKVMSLTPKSKILRVTCFLNDPYDADLFCCIFYECICWWCY